MRRHPPQRFQRSATPPVEALEPRALLTAVPGSVSGTVLYRFANHGATVTRPLVDWNVFADVNGNGAWDAGEPAATTALDGSWTLSGLAGGPQTVREYTPSGWTLDPATPAATVDPSAGVEG